MVVQLPEDIVHLICDELHCMEDLASLFNLASTSKQLAPLALAALYRNPKAAGDSDESVGYDADSLLIIQKWSISWRSIIMSIFDRTLYPYHRFLRFLNLRDFQDLLEDDNFKAKIAGKFFADEMARFHVQMSVGQKRRRKVLDVQSIIGAIADELAPKTSMVEHLSGHSGLSSAACARWIRHLPRLQTLRIWDGAAIVDEAMHQAIFETCPNFHSLEMHHSVSAESDHSFGKFLGGMKPQTLRNFATVSNCLISNETCLGLSSHFESLRELGLCLTAEGIPAMGLLRGCTAIEVLRLEVPPDTDLEGTQNDVFKEVAAWLQDCKQLRGIAMMNLKDAPGLLMPKLLESPENLIDLSVFARGQLALYSMKDNRSFHQALGNLRGLRALDLIGDPEDCTRDDIDNLVASLARLDGLKSLTLRGVSDFFSDDATIALLRSLSQLQEVYVTGLSHSDEVLQVIPTLREAKIVALAAENSTFTALGIRHLIDRLGSGNEGLELNISLADPDTLIPETELQDLREALMEKVGKNGRLEYQATRDPNVSEFEGESD